jgi:hypothetical protein
MNRPLHPRERDALNALLAPEFAGAAELRAQAETALAATGTLMVDLVVDESVPRAVADHPARVHAAVDGAGYYGGLILWVDNRRLSALEYWWVTEAEAISSPVVENWCGLPLPSFT